MGFASLGMTVAATPLLGGLRLGQRWLVGRDAVLDLTIEHTGDLLERTAALHRLRRVGADPRIGAVLLRLKASPGGWAAAQDLRTAIAELRRQGKPVYAWLETPGNAVTWIAAACDRVFLLPTTEVGLVGVGVELTFFGAALQRLGVRPDFEAAGAYKSFGEPWTRSYPSPANHEAVRELVDDLHDQLVAGIAEGRKRPVDDVRALLARAPIAAKDALEAGLVDELLYEDQLVDWIRDHHGKHAKLVPFPRWAWLDALTERLGNLGRSGTTVAVLHLQGPIVLDDRQGPSIVARRVAPLIKALREDDGVGAVVLHIDSPGGSALASDLLWREVDLLKKAKPVVAAFEDVAASGGFYLAAPANAIVARRSTLTGSIGVFGGKLVLGEGLRNVGVHTAEVLGAPNANLFSPSRHFSGDQRERFRRSLERFYDGFVGRVAAGRGRPVEDVEPHCRGRVWTGRAARDRGLVDVEGTLDDAIARAGSLAGLQEGRYLRRHRSGHPQPLLARVVQGMARQVMPATALRWASLAERWLAGPGAWMLEVAAAHPSEPLAMLPFDVEAR